MSFLYDLLVNRYKTNVGIITWANGGDYYNLVADSLIGTAFAKNDSFKEITLLFHAIRYPIQFTLIPFNTELFLFGTEKTPLARILFEIGTMSNIFYHKALGDLMIGSDIKELKNSEFILSWNVLVNLFIKDHQNVIDTGPNLFKQSDVSNILQNLPTMKTTHFQYYNPKNLSGINSFAWRTYMSDIFLIDYMTSIFLTNLMTAPFISTKPIMQMMFDSYERVLRSQIEQKNKATLLDYRAARSVFQSNADSFAIMTSRLYNANEAFRKPAFIAGMNAMINGFRQEVETIDLTQQTFIP